MKENSEKNNEEKGYVYLATSEGGDAENYVHKTKTTSQKQHSYRRENTTPVKGNCLCRQQSKIKSTATL